MANAETRKLDPRTQSFKLVSRSSTTHLRLVCWNAHIRRSQIQTRRKKSSCGIVLNPLQLAEMSGPNWQEEAMRRLRQMQQTRGRPGMGGGPPNIPKGTPFLAAGAFLLLGGGYVLSNSLFNVDGGHRAIKYRRISGVSKEIYSEGKQRKRTGSSGLPQRILSKVPTLTGLEK